MQGSPPGTSCTSDDYVLFLSHRQEDILIPSSRGATSHPAVTFAPEVRTLTSGGHGYTIRGWEVFTGKEMTPLRGYQKGVDALSVSPNGKLLASADADNTVREGEMKTGQERYLNSFPQRRGLLSGRGTVTASLVGPVKVIDTATLSPPRRWSPRWPLPQTGRGWRRPATTEA
jgi:WD40 repeat protein